MLPDVELVEAVDADFAWLLDEGPARRGFTLAPGGIEPPDVMVIVRRMSADLRDAGCDGSWLIVHAGEVVGTCSFRRPPADARVEIGYGIAPSRRNRGYATRAVGAILARAPLYGVAVVEAETALANAASQRVLEHNGFTREGERDDPGDGRVVRWERIV